MHLIGQGPAPPPPPPSPGCVISTTAPAGIAEPSVSISAATRPTMTFFPVAFFFMMTTLHWTVSSWSEDHNKPPRISEGGPASARCLLTMPVGTKSGAGGRPPTPLQERELLLPAHVLDGQEPEEVETRVGLGREVGEALGDGPDLG